VFYATGLQRCWVPLLPPWPRPFNRVQRFFSVRRSTRNLRPWLHPPASFPSPPECYARLPALCAALRRRQSASLGVPAFPHRGINNRRPLSDRRSHSPALRSVRGVSHALDGLLRQLPCGFVSPRSHVQGLPFRGLSLSAEPCRLSPAASCPLAVQNRPPFTSRRSLDFRALLPAKNAVLDKPVKAPSSPLPSWASLLRVLPSRTVRALSRPLRPSASPQNRSRGCCPAYHRCELRLACVKATDPLEVCDL